MFYPSMRSCCYCSFAATSLHCGSRFIIRSYMPTKLCHQSSQQGLIFISLYFLLRVSFALTVYKRFQKCISCCILPFQGMGFQNRVELDTIFFTTYYHLPMPNSIELHEIVKSYLIYSSWDPISVNAAPLTNDIMKVIFPQRHQ